MNIFHSGLIRKFAVYSLLAFALTGIGLTIIISKHISSYGINAKIDMLDFALSNAAIMASSEAEHLSKLEVPSDDSSLPHLVSHLNAIGVSDYFIWDKAGNLVSQQNAGDQEIRVMPTRQNLKDGSNLSSTYEVVKTGPIGTEKLLRITTFHKSDTTDESYTITATFPYAGIEAHQNMLVKNVIIAVSAGLLLLYILLIRVLANTSKTLVSQKDSLDYKNQELEKAYEYLNISFHASVQALAVAVDARDPYTAGHVTRVMDYSKLIGKEMGLNQDAINQLLLAAQLHDIGKIGIPDTVLLKPGRLTDDEYALIKTHPDIGISILKNIPDFNNILPAVRHHHERYDGNGYPCGLLGSDIPLEARIIAVADAYDAMTTNRPYRHSLSLSIALQELVKNSGTQFDPEIIDVFIQILNMESDSDSVS